MSKAIEIQHNRSLARREAPVPLDLQEAGYSKQQLAVVKQTVAQDLTDHELIFFLTFCRNADLDPFQKEVYAIVRKGAGGRSVTFQTGIDALRRRAHQSGAFAGMDAPGFGRPRQVKAGNFNLTVPDSCTFRVYKVVGGIRVPFEATARWSEYAPPLDKPTSFMWRRRPYAQLEKCAEALALRRAFQELRGLYTHDEFAQPSSDARELPLPAARMDPEDEEGIPPETPEEAPSEPRTVEAREVAPERREPPSEPQRPEGPPSEAEVSYDDWKDAIDGAAHQEELMNLVPLIEADTRLSDGQKRALGQRIRQVGPDLPKA